MILEANVKGITDTVCKAANLNRDGELTPLEQVSKLAMPPATAQNGGMASWIWTTMDWHNTYYLNVLLEIARARKTRLEIEPRYTDFGHTQHCAVKLLKWVREESDTVAVNTLNRIGSVNVYP
jgi:hypothetical protein